MRIIASAFAAIFFTATATAIAADYNINNNKDFSNPVLAELAQVHVLNSACPDMGPGKSWTVRNPAPVDEFKLNCTDDRFHVSHRVTVSHTKEETEYYGELCLSPGDKCIDHYEVYIYDLEKFFKGATSSDIPMIFQGEPDGRASYHSSSNVYTISCYKTSENFPVLDFAYETLFYQPKKADLQLMQTGPAQYQIKYHNDYGADLNFSCAQ